MSIVINPLSYSLSLYDVCVQTKDAKTCQDYVAGAIPSVVATLLQTYETCKQTLSADACRSMISSQKYDITSPLWMLAIGFAIGRLLR